MLTKPHVIMTCKVTMNKINHNLQLMGCDRLRNSWLDNNQLFYFSNQELGKFHLLCKYCFMPCSTRECLKYIFFFSVFFLNTHATFTCTKTCTCTNADTHAHLHVGMYMDLHRCANALHWFMHAHTNGISSTVLYKVAQKECNTYDH